MTETTKRTDPNEELYQKIRRALSTWRPTHQSSKDPDGDYTLEDILTPPWENNITLGVEECDNLADYIVMEIT
jgi:hypothetical protein